MTIPTDAGQGALTSLPRSDRVDIEAACARMDPDPARVAAAIAQLRRHAGTATYWEVIAGTLIVAADTVNYYHALECRTPGCRSCSAIRFAATVVAAHHAVAGGD